MCLKVNPNITIKDLKKKTDANGLIKVWKVLRVNKFNVTSPLYRHTWKLGWNYSSRIDARFTLEEKRWNEIERGIHVFLNRESARRYKKREFSLSSMLKDLIIVPLYVKKEDFVAGAKDRYTRIGQGLKEAVFVKACLKTEDYRKAIKSANNPGGNRTIIRRKKTT